MIYDTWERRLNSCDLYIEKKLKSQMRSMRRWNTINFMIKISVAINSQMYAGVLNVWLLFYPLCKDFYAGHIDFTSW